MTTSGTWQGQDHVGGQDPLNGIEHSNIVVRGVNRGCKAVSIGHG